MDQETENSLQYAFIEFEEEAHCEDAYFKMDNVLIDDRRIHVDFSQSAARLNRPIGSMLWHVHSLIVCCMPCV